jgi:hypothetical protein
MLKKYRFSLFLLLFTGSVFLAGCSASKTTETEEEETSNPEISYKEAHGAVIMSSAEEEQQNEMYTKSNDLTYLYWLDNKPLHLKNRTKCNVYAMNVLYKAGFRTPKTNVLTYDLFDTAKFTDVLPVVGISDPESAKKGDLIAWNGHVIIFDYLVEIKKDMYAMAWWAGTSQKDNGDNVVNNVVHGKYRLNGYYIVRRPVKK